MLPGCRRKNSQFQGPEEEQWRSSSSLLLLLFLFRQGHGLAAGRPRAAALDGDDAAQEGVAQHGHQPHQHRQQLVAPFVGVLLRFAAVGARSPRGAGWGVSWGTQSGDVGRGTGPP